MKLAPAALKILQDTAYLQKHIGRIIKKADLRKPSCLILIACYLFIKFTFYYCNHESIN